MSMKNLGVNNVIAIHSKQNYRKYAGFHEI